MFIKFLLSKRIIIFAAVFLSCITGVAYAESSEIGKLALKGLDNCYHFRWDEAEKTFDRIIKKYPGDPRGYHYKSTVYLWYYLSTNAKEDYDNFVKYSNLVLEKSEAMLDKNPDDQDIKYILGTNYSCRAMIFMKAGNYLDAIWASKESESHLSEVIDKDPRYYDAYLGLGLYNFAVDQIPSAFKWALSLAGISGDEKKGLAYIKTAAEKGTYISVEAQYYLSQILSEAKMDFTSAGTYLKKLSTRYPDNLLFNYSTGVLEIKAHNLKAAEKHISKILRSGNLKFIQLKAFSYFLMGDILFRQNDFSNASMNYEKFLASAVNKDYTGIAAFRLAVCYEMLDDRKGAVTYFNLTSEGNSDLDDDIFAKRKGMIYAGRVMTPTEKELVKYANMIEAGLYTNAIDSLKGLLNNKLAEKIKTEVYLLLSDASFYAGKSEGSVDFAVKAIGLNPGEEKWISPFACYYAARGYSEINKDEKMNDYIEKAEDYSDYDYQNKLERLIETLKDHNNPVAIN